MDSEIRKRFRTPLLALFTFLGFLFAYIESNRVSNGAYIPMEDVSLPDGHQAIDFDLGEHNELYALTKDGEMFMRWADSNEGGWVRTDDKQSPIVLCNEMSFADLPVPKPPGKSIQSIDCFTLNTPDARTYERFVIQSNGEIWHWKLIKGIAEGFAGLAMFLIDVDYNGELFDMEKTVFAKNLGENGEIKVSGLTDNIAVIAIDKHGNESKPFIIQD